MRVSVTAPVKMLSTAVADLSTDCTYLIVHNDADKKQLIIVTHLHKNSHRSRKVRTRVSSIGLCCIACVEGSILALLKETACQKCVCVCVCVRVCVCV